MFGLATNSGRTPYGLDERPAFLGVYLDDRVGPRLCTDAVATWTPRSNMVDAYLHLHPEAKVQNILDACLFHFSFLARIYR